MRMDREGNKKKKKKSFSLSLSLQIFWKYLHASENCNYVPELEFSESICDWWVKTHLETRT